MTGCPVHAPGLNVAVTPWAPPGTSAVTGELKVNAQDGVEPGTASAIGGPARVATMAAIARNVAPFRAQPLG
jgi:hypothetical protein